MNRRIFLALVGALPIAGCRPPGKSAAERRVNAADRERIAHESRERDERIAELANCQVSSTATRTTPARPVDITKEFPELKARLRVAIRLHPRASSEPAINESKMAGQRRKTWALSTKAQIWS